MNPPTTKSSSARVEGTPRKTGGNSNFEKYLGSPDQMQNFKKPLYILLGILIVADFFIHREHATLMWESIPGFNALYALIATVLIIVISKFLGHVWLMKPEDYYD
jgi:hypothetical protein